MCDASSSSATTLIAACITVSHDTALLCARSATCTLVCSRKEAFVLVSYVQPRGMYKVSPASSSVAYHRNKLACRFANLSRAFLVVSVDVFVHARARARKNYAKYKYAWFPTRPVIRKKYRYQRATRSKTLRDPQAPGQECALPSSPGIHSIR